MLIKPIYRGGIDCSPNWSRVASTIHGAYNRDGTFAPLYNVTDQCAVEVVRQQLMDLKAPVVQAQQQEETLQS